jgi:hypothetical protein
MPPKAKKGAGILFTGRPTPLPFFRSLFRLYRTGGADILAGAAIDARLGIYHVNARIAQRDRSHGAGIGASAASYAFVRDFMCHNGYLRFH